MKDGMRQVIHRVLFGQTASKWQKIEILPGGAFFPSKLSFGAFDSLAESSMCQVAEFLIFKGLIEENERLLIEGYLSHKWSISLPSEHPWAFEQPSFGEIVSEGATPVGITSQTLAPIIVNRKPVNQTNTSASLTGQVVSAGLGLVEDAPFSPSSYSGLRLWLDASDADGNGIPGSDFHDAASSDNVVPWTPSFIESDLWLDANDSSTLSNLGWSVQNVTGDTDSFISSANNYTSAINVNGGDVNINGVTFLGQTSATASGWEIMEGLSSTFGSHTRANVEGALNTLLNSGFLFGGDPQKIKLTGLTDGETYTFSLYSSAWGSSSRTCVLSCSDTAETVTVDQDGFHDASYNGLLVECTYIADGTEVTFTIDPTAAATWHLYAFSNRIESNLDVVTKWNDKSGKGKAAVQQLSISRPSRLGSLSSLPAVRFDGIDDFLDLPLSASLSDTYSGFFVTEVNSDTNTLWAEESSNDWVRNHISLTSANEFQVDQWGPSSGSAISPSLSGTVLVCVVQQSSQNRQIFYNGVAGPVSTEEYENDLPTEIRIGARLNGDSYSSTQLGELILFAYAMDDEERQRLEGYLANKWTINSGLPLSHPHHSHFIETYDLGSPIALLADKSGQGNDALQDSNESQPGYIPNSMNGNPILRFDGVNDFLEFEEVNTIRTLFMVVKRNAGNQGFILGHDTSYAFHPGSNSVWSATWTDTYLLNGLLHVNGNSFDGLSQNYAYGSPTLLSIKTTDVLPATSFSKDRANEVYWNGDLAELIIYQEELPVSTMRMVEGYLAHKWGIAGSLVETHPFKSFAPVRNKAAVLSKIYWGGADGGNDPNLWENVIDIGEVNVGLRKLSHGITLIATPPPNESAGTYPASKLLDGQLPLDGWRSTWTAWFKSNPQLLFNLGKKREMNKIRIYFQPYERAAELEEVKVYIADEEMNFELLDSFPGGPGLLQQGKYAEFDMNGITTQAIRLEPSYDGWGHMWGEVEFWVYDTGEFEAPVYGLSPGQTYYYRSYGSNNGGSAWAPYTKSFKAEDRVYYDSGKLVIHTDLGTWKHSNGDIRYAEISDRSFTDQFGNTVLYKVSRFEFDQIELLGDLEVEIKGESSLEIITTSGDIILDVDMDISGHSPTGETPGRAGPGGFNGGDIASRGIGPGGGLGGVTPGGAGYGGAGARSTSTTGQPYGDGRISSLIGGSGGGGYTVDSAGGGGGGALKVESFGDLTLSSVIRAVGGGGSGGSAGGSGGAIHLKANHLHLTENSLIDTSGGGNGGAGGRIYLEGTSSLENKGSNNLLAKGAAGAIPGTSGSIRYLRPSSLSDLSFSTGTLVIDTDAATISHSNGSIAFGEIDDMFFKDKKGAYWPYSVCRFKFSNIDLNGNLVVQLSGKNTLELEALGGSIEIGSNLIADGGDASGELGGNAHIGGFAGVDAGELAGNGPGSPLYTATSGHGAAFGGHGSGEAPTYGERDLQSLIGGSAGGSSSKSGSGAGGGVISLKASAEITIHENVFITANGGDGGDNAAAGTGGAIRLEATRIFNHGTLQANAGNGVLISGNSQTRGSSGGRIALIANGEVKAGKTFVNGEWLSNEGTLFIGGTYLDSTLEVENADLTVNTTTGYFSVEGGAHGCGVFTPATYTNNLGQNWHFEICTFTFSQISITGESEITLLGNKPLVLKTVAGGDIRIDSDMILDGGDASNVNGYGGRAVLNPWPGSSAEKLSGFGPGGPPPTGAAGVSASYNYGDEELTLLLPGSGGASGSFFQGSGAGGGALSLEADGDIIVGSGAVLSAKGGNGRTSANTAGQAGGGSGGAIRLIAKNIYNGGLIRVDGGNRGAGGGRALLASQGNIERGTLSIGTGSFKEIKPPSLAMPGTINLSYNKPVFIEKKVKVKTRPQNLRLHFPFDEGQGLITHDMHNDRPGKLTGGTSWGAGFMGSALSFNGQDGYLSTEITGADLGVDGKKPRTVSFWVNAFTSTTDDPGFYGYGSYLDSGGINQYWGIHNISGSNYTTLDSGHWNWSGTFTHGASLLDTSWVHFAHLYDGNSILLYKNGILADSKVRDAIGTGNQVFLQVGRWENNSNAYFKGLIDDFRVYDDALTETEVQTIGVGQDVYEETKQMQFDITATGDPTEFYIDGLPSGLTYDSKTGKIIGLPLEIGTFDLDITALNQAGQSEQKIKLIVNKTSPTLTSSVPKNVSSTTARLAGRVISDGGTPVQLSLFWGENDGGTDPTIDNADSTKWDNRFDLDNNFTSGGFNHFVQGLEKNSTYFYRWLGGNEANPAVWSQPTLEGIIHWWKFDETEGSLISNEISSASGTSVGLKSTDRIFAHEGRGISLLGDGSHVVIKSYKGVVRSNPRTVSMWVKTSDANASLISWGADGDGEKWDLSLENGKLKLDIGNGVMLGGATLNNNQWNHIAVSLPAGSSLLSDSTLYANGVNDTVSSSQFNLNPLQISPDIWLDATSTDYMDKASSNTAGSPVYGEVVNYWGNQVPGSNYNAVKVSGNPVFEIGLNSTFPCVNTNGDSFEITNSANDFDQLTAMSITFVVDWLNTSTGERNIWKQGGGSGWYNGEPSFWIGKFNTGARQGTGVWYTSGGSWPDGHRKLNGSDVEPNSSDARNETKIISVIYDGANGNNKIFSNGYLVSEVNNMWSSLYSSEENIRIGGGNRYGDVIICRKALSSLDREYIEGYIAHKFGLNQKLHPDNPYREVMDYMVKTGNEYDVTIGTNVEGNHLHGVIDEVRIYDRGLAAIDIRSLALGGTIEFKTSAIPSPPSVEILSIQAEANATVQITAELTEKDENLPSVSIYYGRNDGGFEASQWEHNQSLFGGTPVNLGEFNATVSGLIPGEKYFFRVFAESMDGTDWSSGSPEINQDLLAFWRMDESNGTLIHDSVFPFYHAELEGLNLDSSRSGSFQGNALNLDGWSQSIHLDRESEGFLNHSFEGRTVAGWIKPKSNFYIGPTITAHEDLVAYFPADEGSGSVLDDLSINNLNSNMQGGTAWSDGLFDRAISFDGSNDNIAIKSDEPLNQLHRKSYSITLWVNPTAAAPGLHNEGQLRVSGYRVAMSDSYFTDISSAFALTPSGHSTLTTGPDSRGLDYQNDTDFISSGVGIGTDNYLVIFSGSFQAKVAGNYNWEILGNDNRGALWIDLDQNGEFESMGSQGQEKVLDSTAASANTSVNLLPGYYKIALIHGEKTGGSSQQLKFSAPSSDAGPTILTTVKPSDTEQSELFVTENSYTILKRDSLSLSVDGNYFPSFQHANYSESIQVQSSQSLSESTWSHLGVVVDYNASTVEIYVNGVSVGNENLPAG